jgi:uncharacterized phage protein (TIGR02218 family)
MKIISAGLASHLASRGTTLATCWKVTRTDSVVFGFTDHDVDLTVSAVLYVASTGYTRSAIQTDSALAVDNLDLEGVFDSAAITEADLRAGLWDYASVEIFLVNWADLTQGTMKLRKGRLGQSNAGKTRYTTELRGLMQHLQQEVGRIYGPADDVDLGDARSGINIATYTVTGTITSVTNNRIFADTGRTEATNYFDYGKLTFTSGLNNGLGMEVKTFTSGADTFELQLPMPYDVQIGDTYSVYAGYDKSLTQALNKFNNVVNFRGFPFVPGTDRMMSGGI